MKKEKSKPIILVDKFILSIIGLTLALLIGGIFLISRLTYSLNIKPEAKAKVKVDAFSHDWGEIFMNDGPVEANFKIENVGTSPLKLYKVKTSCMCTTARLQLNGQKSPVFGMHSKSNYVMSVPPGQSASLQVVFDPAYHGPAGTGPITRQVEVATNDINRPLLTFNLSAVVIQKME